MADQIGGTWKGSCQYRSLPGLRTRYALTAQEEPAGLISVQFVHQIRTVAVQDGLATFEKRDLQIEVVQDLDERALETWDFHPILDATDEADGVNLRPNVLQQSTDERYVLRG